MNTLYHNVTEEDLRRQQELAERLTANYKKVMARWEHYLDDMALRHLTKDSVVLSRREREQELINQFTNQ